MAIMKILKPGNVEMRRFVCPKCGCDFTAAPDDCEWAIPQTLCCPQKGCDAVTEWDKGEPYEEPAQDENADRERLRRLVQEWNTNYFGGVNAAAEFLLENGVTFREE